MLLLAGGLEALQTMTIASAFPMIFLILIGAFGLLKSLNADRQLMSAVQNHSTTVQYSQANTTWKERLNSLIKHPKLDEVKEFLAEIVRPGLYELKDEMVKKDLDVELVEKSDSSISFVIKNGDVEDFKYQVQLREFEVPEYAPEDNKHFVRAEVFLRSGGQDYDIFGYTKEQVVADVLTQYEKHYHFLHKKNS